MPIKPKLGQNFLISATAPAAIVAALGDLSNVTVLEIGPGRGAITDLLAPAAARTVAVEYDGALARELTARYAGNQRVEIVPGNILDFDLDALAEHEGHPVRVVGNLPYGITSEILLHLFAHHEAWHRAVLMVQREVADRITAPPGTSDYGLLSATTQLYAHAEAILTLPPSAFSPPPEVYSTVFRLEAAPQFARLGVQGESFLPFLRRCFAQKRKTLSNNLRNAGHTGAAAEAALATCGLDPQVRAEAVPLPQMAHVFRALTQEAAAGSGPSSAPASPPGSAPGSRQQKKGEPGD